MGEVHVVMDYQNIHLTGHGLWCPESDPAHLCLIHPLHYAQQIVQTRNMVKRLNAERNGQPRPAEAILGSVHAYRGLPSNKHDPRAYRRSLAQQAEWTRDPRCEVNYRPLKYYSNGRGGFDVQEKGIDVMVALDVVVRSAKLGDSDVVILASHDTDLEPALEVATRMTPGRVETVSWMNSKRLRVPGTTLWHTALAEDSFVKCRDLKPY